MRMMIWKGKFFLLGVMMFFSSLFYGQSNMVPSIPGTCEEIFSPYEHVTIFYYPELMEARIILKIPYKEYSNEEAMSIIKKASSWIVHHSHMTRYIILDDHSSYREYDFPQVWHVRQIYIY